MRRIAVTISIFALLTGLGPVASARTDPAASRELVYMSLRDGNGDIFMLRAGSSVRVKGAASPGHDCGPARWRGPGRGPDRLVFESNRRNEPLGDLYDPNNFEIYLSDMATGRTRRLTTNPGTDAFPSWSPDGRRIAFAREYPQHANVPTWSGASPAMAIWVMNADGSRAKQLTPPDPSHAYSHPAWSPDGKKIAFSLITLGQNTPASPPAISVMDADGSHIKMLAPNGERPAWSPDGKHLVFDSSPVGGSPLEHDLFVMRSDGSRLQRLGHLEGAEMMPSWSPDGRHIAYMHDADGFLGAVTAVLPNGEAVEAYESGPEPSQIWELELDGTHNVVARRRLSNGTTDLLPRYAHTA